MRPPYWILEKEPLSDSEDPSSYRSLGRPWYEGIDLIVIVGLVLVMAWELMLRSPVLLRRFLP